MQVFNHRPSKEQIGDTSPDSLLRTAVKTKTLSLRDTSYLLKKGELPCEVTVALLAEAARLNRSLIQGVRVDYVICTYEKRPYEGTIGQF